jgi:hypothetical protein
MRGAASKPSVKMAGGSLEELNYWRRAGSRVRLMTAPHVQVIQIHSSSAPPSSSHMRDASPGTQSGRA